MPKLIRVYITQAAIGFGLSAVLVGAMLWLNVANLGHLVMSSDAGLLAGFMLWVFNGIVLGGAQFAFTILSMGNDDDEPRGGHRKRLRRLTPIKVEATAQAPRRPGQPRR